MIDHLSTAMIAPAAGTSPDVITKAVREQTVATTKDLKDASDPDLQAARQIVPLIAVGAARGATDIGAPFGAVVSAVIMGTFEGTTEVGGDPSWAVWKAAVALIREAGQQDADLGLTAVGVVNGAADAQGHPGTAITEAAVEGVMDGSAQIGREAEQTVERTLRHTDYLPQGPITRMLTRRTETIR